MPKAIPIHYKGVEYPSRRALARKIGVSVQAVCDAERNGTLLTLGVTDRFICEYQGVIYKSMAEAGRLTGKTRQAISLAIDRELNKKVPR